MTTIHKGMSINDHHDINTPIWLWNSAQHTVTRYTIIEFDYIKEGTACVLLIREPNSSDIKRLVIDEYPYHKASTDKQALLTYARHQAVKEYSKGVLNVHQYASIITTLITQE